MITSKTVSDDYSNGWFDKQAPIVSIDQYLIQNYMVEYYQVRVVND